MPAQEGTKAIEGCRAGVPREVLPLAGSLTGDPSHLLPAHLVSTPHLAPGSRSLALCAWPFLLPHGLAAVSTWVLDLVLFFSLICLLPFLLFFLL